MQTLFGSQRLGQGDHDHKRPRSGARPARAASPDQSGVAASSRWDVSQTQMPTPAHDDPCRTGVRGARRREDEPEYQGALPRLQASSPMVEWAGRGRERPRGLRWRPDPTLGSQRLQPGRPQSTASTLALAEPGRIARSNALAAAGTFDISQGSAGASMASLSARGCRRAAQRGAADDGAGVYNIYGHRRR